MSKKISQTNKTFIIAEVGVNHNADLRIANELIDAAVWAGADAVKFQVAIPELVVTTSAPKAAYQDNATRIAESQLEMIQRIHFPLNQYPQLKDECQRKGIIFFASAFDMQSLLFIETLGQPMHKIPSGEITNLPYLRAVGSYRRPILLSTGMATLKEIGAALSALEASGSSRSDITVLHCNTEYPTPLCDVNLHALRTIAEVFDVKVGYSDHTKGISVPIAAVALGATVIEKHLTIAHTLPGPDHKASLEPNDFSDMVSAIREIELAMGISIKAPTESELKNKPIVRKSLVASRPIHKGELFTPDNVTAKRPGTGISPMLWDTVIGRPSEKNYARDDFIEL